MTDGLNRTDLFFTMNVVNEAAETSTALFTLSRLLGAWADTGESMAETEMLGLAEIVKSMSFRLNEASEDNAKAVSRVRDFIKSGAACRIQPGGAA